jgi:hypothetical protein
MSPLKASVLAVVEPHAASAENMAYRRQRRPIPSPPDAPRRTRFRNCFSTL